MTDRSAPLAADDPRAVAAARAVEHGDTAALDVLLAADPWLATARIGTPEQARTLLHVATDWPGHRPRVASTIRRLVAAGADPDARFVGPHTETPLHWAASCDDVEALDALLDAGADPDAPGAVIAGGTPLTDAAAFGQWRAARRLLERGAVAGPWEAACLGLLERVRELTEGGTPPTADDLAGLFWGACHGGDLDVARYLLARGADPRRRLWDGLTPLDAARRRGAADVVAWLEGQVLGPPAG